MSKKATKIKRRNNKKALKLTAVLSVLLAYGVYTSIGNDGFDVNQVYKIDNVAMNIKANENFTGKIVTATPELIISGDENKVKSLKELGQTPKIELELTDKDEEGVYKVKPKVKDKLIGVNYTFQPSEIEVNLLEQQMKEFDVIERDYGVAIEGYTVGKTVAQEKAKLYVTEDDISRIGQVVVEFDASKVKGSGEVEGNVIVLDKKGEVLPKIEKGNKTIKIAISLDKLGWKRTQEDITKIQDELVTLRGELRDKEKALKVEKDVLRKKDLKKEVKFRKTRIAKREGELKSKQKGLTEIKSSQEGKKEKAERKSILNGGELEQELIDEKGGKQ